MSTTPGLSIIVPLYNVEKYLSDCLDSLLATTGIDETEILLIDDGSTDGSAKTADQYSESHPNIHVIHKENEGPSAFEGHGEVHLFLRRRRHDRKQALFEDHRNE